MPRAGLRRSERDLVSFASFLGYRHCRTANGHLRFTHPVAGIVIAWRSDNGRGERNARAELKRRIARIGDHALTPPPLARNGDPVPSQSSPRPSGTSVTSAAPFAGASAMRAIAGCAGRRPGFAPAAHGTIPASSSPPHFSRATMP